MKEFGSGFVCWRAQWSVKKHLVVEENTDCRDFMKVSLDNEAEVIKICEPHINPGRFNREWIPYPSHYSRN